MGRYFPLASKKKVLKENPFPFSTISGFRLFPILTFQKRIAKENTDIILDGALISESKNTYINLCLIYV